MIGIIIAIIAGLLILLVIGSYNLLVSSRNRVKNGWHQIDVQLKRRIDLIPNLVETVKAYAAHEREVFEKIAEARNQAINARGPGEAARADSQLTSTLKTLFALVENYPDLKANQNFMRLQEELTHTENKIAFARQFYNDVVLDYNNRVQMFPTNIIAALFRFQPAEFYEIPETEREVPKVSF
ncbi:MAG: LemA family protein [candidate division WOR-3 bacterium]|uniref:LemA family protein n=1 Tax=candidate division WOR-3 bacterium TaxID=2052148 RepID=A0A7C1NPL4_UNCW3|nr:LemA family protein [candidate division WOR-3 bacterium]